MSRDATRSMLCCASGIYSTILIRARTFGRGLQGRSEATRVQHPPLFLDSWQPRPSDAGVSVGAGSRFSSKASRVGACCRPG